MDVGTGRRIRRNKGRIKMSNDSSFVKWAFVAVVIGIVILMARVGEVVQ